MKLAIMQPYIFPYIGYFHLINSVDTFIFYDDVNFINSGWVNRNKIVDSSGKELLFTVPSNWSQNKKINEINLSENYNKWKNKFFTTINYSYSKKQFYNDGLKILNKTFTNDINNLSNLCIKSVINVLEYLEIDKKIIYSSEIYNNSNLSAADRIIDICKKENAKTYINTIGGVELYDKIFFNNAGIDLFFIKSTENLNFISIIDIIMNYGKETKNFLNKYELK